MKTITYISLLVISSLWSQSTKFTPEQKEVWSVVEAYNRASNQRNLDKYLSYWHTDFVGWHNGDENTTNKSDREKGLTVYFANSKVLKSKLILKAIQVHQSTAVVHYVIDQSLQWTTGKISTTPSYWTDILIKESGKWYLYSDHGGDVTMKDD